MTLRSLILILGASLMISGCTDNRFKDLPVIQVDDTILSHSYTKSYGIATGLLNIYVIYGNYPLADFKVPAGVCLTPQGFKKFNISQLLVDHPELKETTNAQK